MKINEIITEVFNPETSFPIEWDDKHGPEEMRGRAYDRQGGFIDIKFIALRNGVVEVEFSRNDSYDMTGAGDANRVLATILEAFREYLRGYQPKIFVFSAKGGSRSRVYQSMIQRFAAGAGYKQFDTAKLSDKARKQLGHSGSDVMVLRRTAVTEAFDSLEENFADGKVKGKSRPGRVRRAGASCNGSVTDLRARAKNASGEKAKMYHWCANMKSGRKK